jgi:hypothetical protein
MSRVNGMANVLTATIYESSVVQSLVIALWNDSQGIAVSKRYSDIGNCSRTFSAKDLPRVFKKAQQKLLKCGWDMIAEQSIDFTEIQIDILIHIHVPANKRFIFGERMKFFNAFVEPVKTLLNRRISLSGIQMNDEPVANSYMVVEVTTDYTLYEQKITQIERDLTILLCRKQLEEGGDGDIQIDQIVSFAGIATNHLDMRKASKFIEQNSIQLPLVYMLFCAGRFFYFRQAIDVKDLVYSVSHHSSVISDFEAQEAAHAALKLERERKETELLDLKILAEKEKQQDAELEKLMKLHKFFQENGLQDKAQEVLKLILEISEKFMK